MTVTMPPEVVHALAGQPRIGAREAAMLVLSVDADGSPRATLLSRAELDAEPHELRLTLAGSTTPGNLERTGRGSLLVVVGDTAHTVAFDVVARVEEAGMTALAAVPVTHRSDSLGIPLEPITYTTPPDLPSVERWDRSRALLARLRDRSR